MPEAVLHFRCDMSQGKPIKFLGVGEKTDALEPFHPERIASRILGMGDVLSLIEDVERKVDKKKAEKFAKKLPKESDSISKICASNYSK